MTKPFGRSIGRVSASRNPRAVQRACPSAYANMQQARPSAKYRTSARSSEAALRALTDVDPRNRTLALPGREVFARGQRPIEVIGPLLEEEARSVHEGFWNMVD